MKSLDEKKKDRFLLLNRLYERTDQPGLQLLKLSDIGQDVGLDGLEALKTADYLSQEGLVNLFDDEGRIIAITHHGVLEVEAALSDPSQPTEHFPPLNIIYVENMNNSQIMQASPGGSQEYSLAADQIEKLRRFIETFCNRKNELPFRSEDERLEAEADVQSLEAQLQSPKPKYQIVRTMVQSLTNILEGFSGSMVAAMLVELLKR